MIVHVKVNKSTTFQQLNPVCVTVYKLRKGTETHTISNTD